MASELEERRVEVADLELGMFVSRLDVPWELTDFPLQGVQLTSSEDIAKLRELCEFVYVDARRQVMPDTPSQILQRTELSASRFEARLGYSDQVPFDDEVPRAREALESAIAGVQQVFEDVLQGRELPVESVERAVRPLVASVLRSADAFFWVDGLRRHDHPSYNHAVNCSALAAAFGRHMGFAEETIVSLAAGGLLMDIGKTRVPEALLQRTDVLSPEEMARIRAHVGHGLDIVRNSSLSDLDVIDILRTHHERHDGSGYPAALWGGNIPLVGRMLGIIDTYQALISDRPHRPAMARHNALRQIYLARDTHFQAELVEQFQVCLGVYPTGSMVELTTGEVAVVMAQNQARRLTPRVVILSTPEKLPLTTFQVVDLMNQNSERPQVHIRRSLTPGAYGIDAADLFLQ